MLPIINQRILNRLIIDISINRPSPSFQVFGANPRNSDPAKISTYTVIMCAQCHQFYYIAILEILPPLCRL